MSKIIIPANYTPALNLYDTQRAIGTVKRLFADTLCATLNLYRVSAPLFLEASTGLNDDLNGVERKVTFDIKDSGTEAQVVQSLAKWKRQALKDYGFRVGKGLYCDMNAIRRDEELDNLHSVYVDQWDWEKIISKEERNMETLEYTVGKVYSALKETEAYMARRYNYIEEFLPDEISFITSQELETMYPDKTPKEREYHFAKAKGAVFIKQIGKTLASGQRHDGRAPDYDDWALNADIVVYYPVLDIALELSSMGIRVDAAALKHQLEVCGCEERAEMDFQRAILNDELPFTIGGGIGQSRICMFFLRKAHIGEVQSSLWPEDMCKAAADAGIQLL